MSRLLTRRWIVAHVVVIAAVTTCVLAGRWQLRRLESRRAYNALLESRLAQPPLGPADISAPALAYRRAVVRGTYDGSAQVLLTGRVLSGRTGSDVLTPLRTTDGVAVLVDRGWIPQQIYDPRTPPPPPPTGTVAVTGVLVPSDERGAFGPRIAPTGTLSSLPRLDVARVDAQVPYVLAPYALRLRSQEPAPAPGQPLPSPLAPPGEGPHLSYAIQWFLFATVFAVGYGVLVRRSLWRER